MNRNSHHIPCGLQRSYPATLNVLWRFFVVAISGGKSPLTQLKSKETAMKKYDFSVFISMVFTLLVAASAHAGGIWLNEQAIHDMGVGWAGQSNRFSSGTAHTCWYRHERSIFLGT